MSSVRQVVLLWLALAACSADLGLCQYTDFVVDNYLNGGSDTNAISSALYAAQSVANARIVFANRVYYISGGFNVFDRTNILLEGNGAELRLTQFSGFFYFRGCNGFTVRNMKFDVDPIPFVGGTVTATGNGYFDLTVAAGHNAVGGLPAMHFYEYDPPNRRLSTSGNEFWQADSTATTSVPSQGVIRVPVSYSPQPVGRNLLVRHQMYNAHGIGIEYSSNIVFENVIIYAACGMGVATGHSTNFRWINSSIMKRGQRWGSSTADALHFNNVRGEIMIDGATFTGMADDAINIHNKFLVYWSTVSANTGVFTTYAGGSAPSNTPPVYPGDVIEWAKRSNPYQPIATLTVKSATMNGNLQTIVFNENIPASAATGDVLGVATIASAVIKNVYVQGNRARGFLIQTRNVLIDNVHIDGSSGSCIQVTCDLNAWWEGICTRYVTIQNSRFEACNFGVASTSAAVQVWADNNGLDAPAGAHQDFVFKSNAFYSIARGSLLGVKSTGGSWIYNNTFSSPVDTAILWCNSNWVVVERNSVPSGTSSSKLWRDQQGCTVSTNIQDKNAFAGTVAPVPPPPPPQSQPAPIAASTPSPIASTAAPTDQCLEEFKYIDAGIIPAPGFDLYINCPFPGTLSIRNDPTVTTLKAKVTIRSWGRRASLIVGALIKDTSIRVEVAGELPGYVAAASTLSRASALSSIVILVTVMMTPLSSSSSARSAASTGAFLAVFSVLMAFPEFVIAQNSAPGCAVGVFVELTVPASYSFSTITLTPPMAFNGSFVYGNPPPYAPGSVAAPKAAPTPKPAPVAVPQPAPTSAVAPPPPSSLSQCDSVFPSKPLFIDSFAQGWYEENNAATSTLVTTPAIGSKSISFTATDTWGLWAIKTTTCLLNTTQYSYFHFKMQAATSTSGRVFAYPYKSPWNDPPFVFIASYGNGDPVVGSWKSYNIPLSVFANLPVLVDYLVIGAETNGANFFLDDISFTTSPIS